MASPGNLPGVRTHTALVQEVRTTCFMNRPLYVQFKKTHDCEVHFPNESRGSKNCLFDNNKYSVELKSRRCIRYAATNTTLFTFQLRAKFDLRNELMTCGRMSFNSVQRLIFSDHMLCWL